ncbi:MAG: aminopeptidase P family protein [Parachlamydiales bacterium]|jgi:Xaa-Pro aminopeptidase
MNFVKRIRNLQNYIREKDLDLLIIEDPISLLYLTGLSLTSAKLFIGTLNSKLFVDGRYIQAALESNTIDVGLINEKALYEFICQNEIKKAAFDADVVTYHNYERLKVFFEKIKCINVSDIQITALYNPLRDFRVIKDSDEIFIMKKSAELTWRGFEHISLILKEGITEMEVAFEFENFVKKHGADSLAFNPIICFGKNSAKPHHVPSNNKLSLNDIVLIDIGVSVQNYKSDMTRVLFFGKPDPVLDKMYSITKRAQAAALSLCRPGSKLKDLDLAARKVLQEENYEKEFLHSLGHGVGLEIHEFPRIRFDNEDKDVYLKAGMIITIEPGIYVQDLGGVRYEDTILITNDGYENFF